MKHYFKKMTNSLKKSAVELKGKDITQFTWATARAGESLVPSPTKATFNFFGKEPSLE
mgnify:CR=1 FL=1